MEKLREINFQAILEGQDYEKHLKKIVSIAVSSAFERAALFYQKQTHSNMHLYLFLSQGFSSFHFTPFEVLLVIDQCEKRLNHKFSPEET